MHDAEKWRCDGSYKSRCFRSAEGRRATFPAADGDALTAVRAGHDAGAVAESVPGRRGPWEARVRRGGAGAILLAAAVAALAVAEAAADEAAPRFLVFSMVEPGGYEHAAIPAGIAALRAIGDARGWRIDDTVDANAFADPGLADYDAVVFNNTVGDVLDPAQQAALQRFIRGGGGFVGIHAAADTEHGWPWYGALVGARFENHPKIQPALLRVEIADHPATQGLADPWPLVDEWYNFKATPRALDDIAILLTVDEASYEGGEMGTDHPLAWARAFDGGRAFYTAIGHTEETWDAPAFRRHLAGGMAWAAGVDDTKRR